MDVVFGAVAGQTADATATDLAAAAERAWAELRVAYKAQAAGPAVDRALAKCLAEKWPETAGGALLGAPCPRGRPAGLDCHSRDGRRRTSRDARAGLGRFFDRTQGLSDASTGPDFSCDAVVPTHWISKGMRDARG